MEILHDTGDHAVACDNIKITFKVDFESTEHKANNIVNNLCEVFVNKKFLMLGAKESDFEEK